MSSFANFAAMLRFILRRDRIYLPIWIIALVALATFFVPMLPDMVGDDAARLALEQTMQNPVMVAICGPSFGSESTFGAIYAQFMALWVLLGFAVFNIMFIIRHTRTNEEDGKLEMLGALPVGKNAILLAAMLIAMLAGVVMAVLTAVVCAAYGLDTIDLAGAMAYGFSLAAGGFTFAGIAALMAQLANSAKGTLGITLALLGLSYLLRASGDMSGNALSFISPLGLSLQTQAFVQNLIWPALVLCLEGLAFFAVAISLSSARDLGSGLLPERRGRAHASGLLRGEWSLAWRQVRVVVIAWCAVCLVFSASYGSVMGEMSSFVENNEMYQMLMGVNPQMSVADLTNPVVAMLMLIMTMIATIPVVSVVNHLHTEERRARIEQVASKAISRYYLLAGYLVIALLTAVFTQLCNAVGFWAAAQTSMSEPLTFSEVAAICFSYMPAQLVFAGLATLLVGLAPRLTSLTWVYLAYSFLIFYIGRMINVPEEARFTSPFGALPNSPVDEIEPLVIAALAALTALLAAIGLMAYRRRDLH